MNTANAANIYRMTLEYQMSNIAKIALSIWIWILVLLATFIVIAVLRIYVRNYFFVIVLCRPPIQLVKKEIELVEIVKKEIDLVEKKIVTVDVINVTTAIDIDRESLDCRSCSRGHCSHLSHFSHFSHLSHLPSSYSN